MTAPGYGYPVGLNVNRLAWQGALKYRHGVNMAWLNYAEDFGGGSTNAGGYSGNGISLAANKNTVDGWLAQMQAAKLNTARWFMFPQASYLYTGNRGTGTSIGAISGAVISGGVMTFTVPSTALLTARQSFITTTGITPAGYNVSNILVDSIPDATHVSIGNQFGSPGAYVSGGTMTTGPDAWSNHYFVLDSSGYPIGVQPNVLADLDALVGLLVNRGVALVLAAYNRPTDMPQTKCWNDAVGQDAFLGVMSHIVTRYRSSGAILALEFGNEVGSVLGPFWPTVNPDNGRTFLAKFCNMVHAAGQGNILAGVTAGSPSNVGSIVKCGADYIGASWYYTNYHAGNDDDLSVPTHDRPYYVANYGVDVPMIVTECQVDNNNGSGIATTADAIARYNAMYHKGFAGCWGWSLTPSAADGMRIDLNAATQFSLDKGDL